MNEDIFAIAATFGTGIILAFGIPLMRAHIRRKEREPILAPTDPLIADRLARIEHAVEAMAIEVERISEGQRFVTRLLAERDQARAELPAAREGTREGAHEPHPADRRA